MIYRSMFPSDIFADFDRLQRSLWQAVESEPSIRGFSRGAYPALNVASTPQSVELYAFAPGLDPSKIEVNLERDVLTISGERASELPTPDEKTTVHVRDRFAGRFRRVVSLPDDVNPNGVSAQYRDGVLHVSVKRREAVQPRRISVE